MIIIHVKEGESIDRALKQYKRKHRDVKLMKEIRRRQHFVKPSVKRRDEIIGAMYREKKFAE